MKYNERRATVLGELVDGGGNDPVRDLGEKTC